MSSNKIPINIISITKSNCVTTLDKLAKKPYFQKEKLVIVSFIFDEKLIFNFLINKRDVNKGVIKRAIAYPFSLNR